MTYQTTRHYIRVMFTVVRTSDIIKKENITVQVQLHLSPCCTQACPISSDMGAPVIDRHSHRVARCFYSGRLHVETNTHTQSTSNIYICVHSSNKYVSVCLSFCSDKNMPVLDEASSIIAKFLTNIFKNYRMGRYNSLFRKLDMFPSSDVKGQRIPLSQPRYPSYWVQLFLTDPNKQDPFPIYT